MGHADDDRPASMSKRETDPFPSVDDISARAPELFVNAGRDASQIPRCWREAETELLTRAADRLIGARAPSRRRPYHPR